MSTPFDNANSSVTAAQSARKGASYLLAEEKEAFQGLSRVLAAYGSQLSVVFFIIIIMFYSVATSKSTVNTINTKQG